MQVYTQVEQRRLARLGPEQPPDQLLLRARMGLVNVLDELGDHTAAEKLCTVVASAQEDVRHGWLVNISGATLGHHSKLRPG